MHDVHTRTAEWFDGVDLGVLDTVIDASDGLSELAGIGRSDADWLHDMWTDKPSGGSCSGSASVTATPMSARW